MCVGSVSYLKIKYQTFKMYCYNYKNITLFNCSFFLKFSILNHFTYTNEITPHILMIIRSINYRPHTYIYIYAWAHHQTLSHSSRSFTCALVIYIPPISCSFCSPGRHNIPKQTQLNYVHDFRPRDPNHIYPFRWVVFKDYCKYNYYGVIKSAYAYYIWLNQKICSCTCM